MATTVDTLLVRIEADMSDLKRSLKKVERDVDKSSKKIGSSFSVIGTAMKGAVAGVLVQQGARAGMALVNLASDVEEMQGKSKVVFGEFRDSTVAALEVFGDEVGRATHELEGMAASIQDTFVPMGFARGAAADLSIQLTKLAVDVASFNNASDTETMAAFQSALVGNHETVRRFGVVITEATLKQELLRMGIKRTGAEVTNAEKVQARLNLIINGTSDAHGDAARTSDSYANSLRGLKAELSEIGKEIGEKLLPLMTGLISMTRSAMRGLDILLYGSGLKSSTGDVYKDLDIAMQTLEDFKKKGAPTVQIERLEALVVSASLAVAEYDAALISARKNENQLGGKKNKFGVVEPTLDGPEGQGPKYDEVTNALIRENALIRAQAKLQVELRQAELSGSRDAIILAEKRLSKMTSLSDVTDDMFQAEADHQRGISGGSWMAVPDTVINSNKTAIINYENMIASFEAAREAQKEAQQEADASSERGLNFVRQNIDLAYQYEQVQADLNKAKQAGKITEDEYAQSLAITKQQILELDPLYKQLTDRANQAFDTMADSLTDMVMSGKFDLKSLGDMFKQTVREMIADAIKAQMIKPLLGGVFGAIGTAIGGPVGGFLGNMAGNAIGGSADGGNLNANMPQIVGERGPELIVPKSASNILNNHNTKNALGGGGGTIIQQTINVSAGVSQTVKAEMISLMPRFKQEAMRGVVDAKRRGGSYGQAFG